jgi:CRP-like cAMP-binding protein
MDDDLDGRRETALAASSPGATIMGVSVVSVPVTPRGGGASMEPPETDLQANRILAALSPAERERLRPALTCVRLPIKVVLFEPGEVIRAVHFPLDGVVSLVTPLEGGAIVEVATIGNEGIVGVPLVPGGSLAVRAIAQVAGYSARMDARVFLTEVERGGQLGILVRRYVQALVGQIAQAAACNRLHSNEERLSRWLLMSHDRVGVDEFAITHEFLGQMLGSRRATVTLSAGILQAAGLIRHQRGHVTIVNRRGLEEVACECYQVIKRELDQVVDRPR